MIKSRLYKLFHDAEQQWAYNNKKVRVTYDEVTGYIYVKGLTVYIPIDVNTIERIIINYDYISLIYPDGRVDCFYKVNY